jgi:hypothetical protein
MREEVYMSEKVYKTVAEIDAELDKAFEEAEKAAELAAQTAEAKPTEQENTADNDVEVEVVEETEPVEETKTKDIPVEGNPKVEAKPKTEEPAKETKQDYAFRQLREEATSAKKKLEEYEGSIKQLDEMAQKQGFKNHQEFVEAWREKQIEEEARVKNVDPKILKELNDTKSRLTKIEKERQEAVKEAQLVKINTSINNFASKNKLDDKSVTDILAKMGQDNVTVESLMSTPVETLEKMLTGYAQDIIIERKVQERLASLEKNGTAPAPEKHKNTTTSKKPDPFSKEALDDEMEKFKKANYPWLK